MSRTATTSNTGDAGDAAVLSIERKLELLESRFTQPSGTASALDTSAPTTTSFGAGNDMSNSEHSFSFPPSLELSRSSSNLPPSAVRSRRRPSLKNTLHAVEMATSRHMRRVAANSPIHGSSANASSSHFSAHSLGLSSSSSSQTMLTSNNQHNRVVAETPPIVSPHNRPFATPPKPAAARNLLLNQQSSQQPPQPQSGQKSPKTGSRLGSSSNTVSKTSHD